MDTFATAFEGIRLSPGGRAAVTIGHGNNNFYNAYGSIGIKSTNGKRYKWKLTCKKRNSGCSMFIGIISQRDITSSWNQIDYGYNGGGTGTKCNLGKEEQYGIKWKTNDVIEMTVDFGRQELSYSVNEVAQGIAYNNLRIGPTYYLTASMLSSSKWQIIEINDFKEIELKEEKQNEIQLKLKEENNNLKKEKEQMRNEINALKQEVNKLLDDKKETELEMKEIKQKNERLNRNNLDYSKWKEWDSKNVYYFIMNTVNDGSLEEYADNIKKEIFESEYSGKDLSEIEFHHIQSMGIKKISAKNDVYKAIKQLVQQNNFKQRRMDSHEKVA